jgi:hypothetical protein
MAHDHGESTTEKEEFTDKQIKMAYGVLNDPRLKGGNLTKAVEIIDKIAPGLSQHPGVKKAIRATTEKSDDTIDVKMNPDGSIEKANKEQKIPLGEFILSYYDREVGEFPKGETAVLTMVEKDYGEQFIEPAKAFIEKVNTTFEEFQMRQNPQSMEPDLEFVRMRELAGLR